MVIEGMTLAPITLTPSSYDSSYITGQLLKSRVVSWLFVQLRDVRAVLLLRSRVVSWFIKQYRVVNSTFLLTSRVVNWLP